MALDQKKFAFLTGAIAASIVVIGAAGTGCTINEAKSDKDDNSSSGGESSSSGGESSSSGGSSSGGESSSSGGSSSGGEGCLGDEGAAPTCDPLEGCLKDEQGGYYSDRCDPIASILRPAVARHLIECLKTAPTCEVGLDDVSPCWNEAFERACPDDGAEAFCNAQTETAGCTDGEKAAFVASCTPFAAALTAQGKAGLEECLGAWDSCEPDNFCFTRDYVWDLTPIDPIE